MLSRSGWTLPLAALALVVTGGLAGCDTVDTIDTPTFRADPPRFLFPNLSVGEEAERRVTVTNDGNAELVMVGLTLDDRSSAGEFAITVDTGGSATPLAPDARLVLAPGERLEFVVRYRPTDEVSDGGTLSMATNDPDNLDVQLPIIAGDAAGEINVNPRDIDFGGVEVGETARQMLSITNRGVLDLTITRLELSGREGFDILRDGVSVAGALPDPLVIPPAQSVVLEAIYTPPSQGIASGELAITSDAINGPTTIVNLSANGAAACINVVPSSIDFGAGLLVDDRAGPTLNRQAVVIESCGPTPLRVDRIEFDDPFDAFGPLELPDPAEGALFELPASVDDEPFPTAGFEVGFWPTDLRVYGGQMKVFSNATRPDEPTLVDLFGRGVDNVCPLPLTTEAVYEVQPLDIITLDGSPSDDPDGEVRSWRWTVIQRPDGSVSQPVESFADPGRPADGGEADDPSTPRTQFFVDLAGEYVVELQVVDALGQTSCEPRAAAQVTIHAVPQKDLHVQLVWSTPDDPDETDGSGTDVDLHLVHERADGLWAGPAEPWDCYYGNAQPDWGVIGEVSDNPSLDIDDTNGAGPENINLAEPELGVTYDVGAIYFRATSTFGDPEVDARTPHPSYVSLRLFNRGTPLVELVGREMTETMQLWHMARVTWCEGDGCPRIEIVDALYGPDEYNLP